MKNRETKKRSFNALDWFLLFLILLSVASVLWRQHAPDQKSQEAVTLEVALRVEQIPKEILACIEAGELLYTASGEAFGSILQIDIEPSKEYHVSEGDFYYDAPQGSDRFNLILLVSVQGTKSGDVFLQNGRVALLLGKELNLYSHLATLQARVTKIGETTR
jgi:hypothetical protein